MTTMTTSTRCVVVGVLAVALGAGGFALSGCGGGKSAFAGVPTASEPELFFEILMDGESLGSFREVEGLSVEVEVLEYQNGDDPLTRKRPGRVKYSNITLKRGYVSNSPLWQWAESGRNAALGQIERRPISILLKETGTNRQVRRWNCFECFPTKWRISSEAGKNDVLTEEMTIVVEWFEEA